MPMIAGSHGGKGIHKPLTKLPILEEQGFPDMNKEYEESLLKQLTLIQNRLRRVRITCGDWSRLQGAAIDAGLKKITGIFLDPPYDLDLRRSDLYGISDRTKSQIPIHEATRNWAINIGEEKNRRVAYCSYSTPEEDNLFLENDWKSFRWSAQGGYGLQSDNLAKDNKDKEIIWFSPHCLTP